MSIDRYGIHLGILDIRFYGIIIMLGVIAAIVLGGREARRRDKDPEFLWDALIWILIPGIVGARLWHIITPSPSLVERGITTKYYLTHPLDAINIPAGGLGIVGAVIGGALGLYIYVRRRGEHFLDWVDIIAPGVALAQAIGRWGNFINYELYGAPTNLPWAIFIPPEARLPQYATVEYYHPTFLYESLLNLANMALLLWVGKRFKDKLFSGDIFLLYLVNYSLIRIALEFVRLDSSTVGGINANQGFVLVTAIGAAALLFWRHRSVNQVSAGDEEEEAPNKIES
ncbi:MAG: prolipoprotein diacylglyceryl transferase [Anaerolineales bacterium]|nr:prolipoprotein diacylglyceryl transferase [Anaerolineales bacterium]